MNRFRRPVMTGPPIPHRAILIIEIDLDPMPGAGSTPQSWEKLIGQHLSNIASHYQPEVRAVAIERSDGSMSAIL